MGQPSRHAQAQMSRGEQAGTVYRRLLDRVIRGRLSTGGRVVEPRIAEEFRTSRTPVREALQRLKHEGFRVAQAADVRRGELRIAPLRWSDIAELWQIIGNLEAIAASRVGLLTPAEQRSLGEDLAAINRALRAAWTARPRDLDRAFDLQSQFHRVLVARCGGAPLQVLYNSVRPHIERYEWLYGAGDRAGIEASLAEHDAIAVAVAAGNRTDAVRSITAHWRDAAERSLKVLRDAAGLPVPPIMLEP